MTLPRDIDELQTKMREAVRQHDERHTRTRRHVEFEATVVTTDGVAAGTRPPRLFDVRLMVGTDRRDTP